MDTALAGGDFSLGANGLPRGISGEEELLQRAAIRLRVPLGRFAFQPTLGSRLYTLRRNGGQGRKRPGHGAGSAAGIAAGVGGECCLQRYGTAHCADTARLGRRRGRDRGDM
ncbi:MAG: hypothetical protein ACLVDB_01215 [Anaeromassilibacillus sp.]